MRQLAVLARNSAQHSPAHAPSPPHPPTQRAHATLTQGKVWAPRWLPGMSNMAMSSVTMTAGAIAMILIYPALWAMGVAGDPTLPINAEEWGMLIWVVALGSIGGTFFWNYGVRGIGVVLASLYSNLCPLVAVGIAAALGTPPSVWQLIGGGLVIAGVVQLQLRQAKRP